ncbi:hypothetical protein [Chitinophaga niabensis]|uniref:Uncharacterized protein n=1 Tax=Chitinophaga niabensis TaxID=536979 RepID=A0A1N6JYG3_9BACT|nr:hypothetical protein [Chitinophaga niabensis]SIO49269.1 hypothetical protein SAMN04488055_4684 [Chitinophaga niabensis]
MSKSNDNVITRGASGTFGSQVVFSQRHGNTIMGKPPRTSNIPPTEKQLAVRDRFLTATQYAKAVNANEAQKAIYKVAAKLGQSAYNVALTDAIKPPEIKEIDRSQYTGLTNSFIRINAVDDFKVASVLVIILSQAGDVLEQGKATVDPNSYYWLYAAQTEIPDLTGCTIKVQAIDLPGNVATQELVL